MDLVAVYVLLLDGQSSDVSSLNGESEDDLDGDEDVESDVSSDGSEFVYHDSEEEDSHSAAVNEERSESDSSTEHRFPVGHNPFLIDLSIYKSCLE